KIKGFGFSWKELFQEKLNFVRSSVIGVLIGILPGIGGSLASLMSYNAAKKSSKYPERFGTGINAGIVASETANNAAIGGALIPLLSLGIPGDAVTALLLGAFTMQGVQPGPLLFKNSPQIVYFIFIALFIANFFMLFSEFFAIRGFVRLLRIRKAYLFPIIALLCILGAYGLNNRIFDVVTICIFGIFGYLMKQWGLHTQPFILGYIVGPMAELHFRRGLMYSEGKLLPFVSSPISVFFLLFALASIVLTIVESRRKKTV
ncbi:MAG: tripartite tricarboxylate transporter permease, partial [Sphaerochaetaceae bacterium]